MTEEEAARPALLRTTIFWRMAFLGGYSLSLHDKVPVVADPQNTFRRQSSQLEGFGGSF